MIADPQRIYDGYNSSEAGVDHGREAHLIGKNQWYDLENGCFRGGSPRTRPAFVELEAIFVNPNMAYGVGGDFLSDDNGSGQARHVYSSGTFQGASYYTAGNADGTIMASIGGHLYQLTIGESDYEVRDIKLERRNGQDILIAYHAQADVYLIVQDGESTPIIFDGVSARRAGENEIFTGTIMGVGMGRVVLVRDRQIFFGDIYDGSGQGGLDMLKFTETQFLNEGFPSALPGFMGNPTGITFIPQQDTATGVGECIVFGENGAESFFLSIPRDQWKDSTFQRTALVGIGNFGHRNIATVNSDVFFRSKDGRRSYRQARAESDKWGQIPLSTNVKRYIDSETPALLKYGSAIEFDNRLLTTANPVTNMVYSFYARERLYHNGLLSLDFDVLSTFGGASNPAWDGRWMNSELESLKCFQVVSGKFKGRERAFAFCLDDSDLMQLVEITKTGVTDTRGPITMRGQMRSMDFESEFNEKRLYGGDFWLTDVQEDYEAVVEYRPDQLPEFQPWHEFSGSAITGLDENDVPTTRPGFNPRQPLPQPEPTGEEVTDRIMTRGYEFQTQVTVTGHVALRKFRMQAETVVEDSKADLEAK